MTAAKFFPDPDPPIGPVTVICRRQRRHTPVHSLRSIVMSHGTWFARLTAIAVLASLTTATVSVTPAEAQFGKRLKERLKKNAEDKAIDKAVDKENEAIDAATTGKAEGDTARATAAPTKPGSTAPMRTPRLRRLDSAAASATMLASAHPPTRRSGPTTISCRGSGRCSIATSPRIRSGISPRSSSSRPAAWRSSSSRVGNGPSKLRPKATS